MVPPRAALGGEDRGRQEGDPIRAPPGASHTAAGIPPAARRHRHTLGTGIVQHVTGSHSAAVGPGDVLLVNPSLAHAFVATDGPLRIQNVLFTEQALTGALDAPAVSGALGLFFTGRLSPLPRPVPIPWPYPRPWRRNRGCGDPAIARRRAAGWRCCSSRPGGGAWRCTRRRRHRLGARSCRSGGVCMPRMGTGGAFRSWPTWPVGRRITAPAGSGP